MGPAIDRWLQQPRRFEVEDFARPVPDGTPVRRRCLAERECFDWKRGQKFHRIIDLEDWVCQMRREKACIWGGGDAGLRDDFSLS